MVKSRLDVLLVKRELVSSREEAQRYIRAGKVLVDEMVVDKPGAGVAEESVIRVKLPETMYASRGGTKLEGALERFQIQVDGLTCADLGASNGGFTDCLLQRGARKVFAIDVGHGQLAYHLQTDERVVVMDQTNCRYLKPGDLGEAVDLVVGDLSFISMKAVFPAIRAISRADGRAVLLIKPQFEIGKGRVGKKGIVRDAADHVEVLQDLYQFFQERNCSVIHATYSPIQGKTGNIEFFFDLSLDGAQSAIPPEFLQQVVEEAHFQLKQETSSHAREGL
ncbi:MAG: TlyA family RNA methyltransferase [bacterium]|jgi:23S rRNA (cytidine1920-2'-O)/16S rRNA (cytidine1409-2'-O)-methyltransferase